MKASRAQFLAVLALLLLAASQAASRPVRRLQQDSSVTVSSQATSNGGNAFVSGSGSAENGGQAVVQASGNAGPGQTTVVDCNLAAGNQELQKYCKGIPSSSPAGGGQQTTTSGGGQQTSTSGPSEPSSGWKKAPACKNSPVGTTIVKDQQGAPWGYENNQSCAFRDPEGKPVFAAANAIAQASSSDATYNAAPTCAQDPGAATVVDQSGRKWGWESNKSCAVRSSGNAAVGK